MKHFYPPRLRRGDLEFSLSSLGLYFSLSQLQHTKSSSETVIKLSKVWHHALKSATHLPATFPSRSFCTASRSLLMGYFHILASGAPTLCQHPTYNPGRKLTLSAKPRAASVSLIDPTMDPMIWRFLKTNIAGSLPTVALPFGANSKCQHSRS